MGLFDKMFGRSEAGAPEGDAIANMNKAVALYRKGKYEDALRLVDGLIEAGPDVALSWRFRGECLFALARYADAVEAFDKAGAIGGPGTEEIFLWSALALHNAGEREQATLRLQYALAGPDLSPDLRTRAENALKQVESA